MLGSSLRNASRLMSRRFTPSVCSGARHFSEVTNQSNNVPSNPLTEDNSGPDLFYKYQIDSDTDNRGHAYFALGVSKVVYGSIGRLAVLKAVGAMSASADVLALASVEYDLSNLNEGDTVTIKWRGKPIFIRHRSQEEIDMSLADDAADMRHQETDAERIQNPKYAIVIGICTHLGCVPITGEGEYNGWFCPCHGSHYDLAGRIRQGPAPFNMEIPPYSFVNENNIVIG